MRVTYTVHSFVEERFPAEVEFKGAKVSALVPGFVVELVSDDDQHGHTFRFVPKSADEGAELRKMFLTGAKVVANFTAAE